MPDWYSPARVERIGKQTPMWVVPLIGVMVIAIFAADVFIPLGYAPWVFYLLPLSACLAENRREVPLLVAGVISVLTVVGFYLSPGSAIASVALVNRAFGFMAVWVLGGFGHRVISGRNELDRQNWLERRQAELAEQVRGEQCMTELAGGAIAVLGRMVGAQVGVLYEREGNVLKRVAGWGFEPDDAHPEQLRLGDGLLGQVAADGHVRLLHGPADEGLRVRSGLLDACVRHAVLAPLHVDGHVNGVLELGSSEPIGALGRRLVERVSEPLGVALRSARYREHLQSLLDETQRQSERLRAQQEELRATNEELEHQARQLREAHARLEEQQAELEQTNAHLEEQTSELEAQKQVLVDSQRELESSATELERANRLKSEFLANMSHELRTPLNSTLILSRLLAENKSGNLDAEQIRYAETIYSAGNDLLALIDDILDLSKIEAGRIDVRPADVRLHRLIRTMQDAFEPVATQRRLRFRVEIEPGVPEVVESDPQRLQQILRNLLSNAFKFTEAGEVALLARPRSESVVEIVVQDTGIGIPEDEHEKVFEAFRQADGTTSRQYGGTGLGLSISRRLAALLGAQIELSSKPGEGSRFCLVLPRRSAAIVASPSEDATTAEAPAQRTEAERAATVRAAERRKEGRPQTDRMILVVEDDPSFASTLRELVQEQGFECMVAGTAAEGLELAREMCPAAVLLDVELPDASGLYVLGQLKEDEMTRHVPVHVISVHDQAQTALALGAVGYAVKPVRREQVVEVIQVLQRKLSQQSKRLLLVEDDAQLRADIQELLQADGLEIIGVDTMADALEQLERLTFDCVVLDLQLPDGSGRRLLEKMAARERYAFPPVIVYTGSDIDADEEQLLRRYSQSIIIKGARSPERLLDEVTLFLHHIEAKLPPERRRMLREVRQGDTAFHGRRILLAEDDVRNIFALSSLLEPRGAELSIARNGREALEILAREQTIDLVLMDVMMPEMDGLTAIAAIREQPRHKNLPIIAITAKATREDQRQCLEAGANDYLAKPIEVDKLLSLCRVWMR